MTTETKRTSEQAPQTEPSRDLALKACEAIWDKKGFEVVVLRIKEIAQYTDYMIIASATSDRHASAIADNVEKVLQEQCKTKAIGVEGRTQGRWVLIDFGDIVVHVFHRPVRAYYELERLYADAPRLPLEEPEWIRQTSPDAIEEAAFDYGDDLWSTAPLDAEAILADDEDGGWDDDVTAKWEDDEEEGDSNTSDEDQDQSASRDR